MLAIQGPVVRPEHAAEECQEWVGYSCPVRPHHYAVNACDTNDRVMVKRNLAEGGQSRKTLYS